MNFFSLQLSLSLYPSRSLPLSLSPSLSLSLSLPLQPKGDLVAVGVLSGNRNFEGRVNPHTRANYLASPPLCIAYAIAGTMDIDFEKEPLGMFVS